MAAAILSQETLKGLLHYDAETGVFTWRVSPSSRASAGAVAGTLNKGYQEIKIQGKKYLAHRLAWLYTYGEFPPEGLDHRNRVRSDNRICNLRPATQAENLQNLAIPKNNTSGYLGVCWDKGRHKWSAGIQINGKLVNLGRFPNLEDAIAARKAGKLKYHTAFESVQPTTSMFLPLSA